MKAVLDTNVIVSAVLSPQGAPARILRAWTEGRFELVVSPMLVDELRRTLEYSKIRRYVSRDDAAALVDLIEGSSIVVEDPEGPPPISSSDPDDDYLITLAASTRSLLVTGDGDLLALADQIPVLTPAEFTEQIHA